VVVSFFILIFAGSIFILGSSNLKAQVEAWPSPVRIIYLPSIGKESTLARFKPLSRHLEKVLGAPVESVSFDSYEEMIANLSKGEFEIAYLSPSTYVESGRIAKLEPVAMELDRFGNRGYHGLIICRSNSGYKSLQDVRGKTLAFTNPKSTSGFLVPLSYFMHELKETPDSFARKVVFAGDHQKVIKGVLNGAYDAGATNDVDLNRTVMSEDISADSFRVIWTSDLIPGAPVCVRPDLPEGFKAAVIGALIMFNKDKEGLNSLQTGGFAAANDKDYEMARQLEGIKP